MPVTRINNNQVTDASAGNTIVGINAGTKLQNYSITATKIANNLTYGSDLTVAGNLTVQGNSTAIDTTITTIEDPVIVLASTQTGAPAVDIGFIGERGSSENIAFVWDESAQEFVTAFTNTSETNTTINITGYANARVGNMIVGGTTSLAGNVIGTANFTGNVNAGNVNAVGTVSAASTVGGVITGTSASVTGGVTAASVAGGVITGTSTSVTGTQTASSTVGGVITGSSTSVTGTQTAASTVGGVITGSSVSVTGNVTAANFIGNISGNVTSPGANTQVEFNDNGTTNAVSGFTFNKTSNLVTVGGNVNAANFNGNVFGTSVSASGTVTAASTVGGVITGTSTSVTGTQTAASTVGGVITGSSSSVTGTQTAASTVGGVITGSSTSVTGTQTAASTVGGVITGSSTSVTGSQTAASTVGGVITGSTISTTGNITGPNVNAAQLYNATAVTIRAGSGNINLDTTSGNIVVNNTYINGLAQPVLNQDAATKLYVDNAVTTAISYHEAVVAATTTTLATATGGTVTYAQPNGVANGVGATLTTTGSFNLIDTANVQTVGTRILVKDQANAVQNGVYVWSNATVITRSSDTDTYGPANANALSINDYFFVQSGNVNLGSAWIVDSPAGTITFGTSNIQFAQFSQSQVYSANTAAGLSLIGTVFSAKVDNNTTAFDGQGNISVKAGANLTTPNIGAATGTSLSVTGTVTAASTVGGVITGSSASVTGGVTAASVAGGVITGTSASVTGGVTAASVAGGVITGTSTSVTGTQTAASTVGGVITGTSTSVTGTQTAASTVGGVITGSSVSVTGTATAASTVGGVITGSSASLSGNILTSGNVSVTGNVTAAWLIGNIQGSVTSPGANTQVLFNDGGVANAVSGFTFNKTSNLITVGGNVNATNFNGNVFGTSVSASGTVTAASTVGGVITGSSASVTGTVTAASTVGGVITGSTASLTGNINGANLILSSGFIDGPAAGRITINGSDIDTDFAVDGDTAANVFYVDAGTGTASFGNSTQVTNALVSFQSTNSIRTPVGNTAQRPSVGVTGMLRFNTTTDALEIYDNDSWASVGTPTFTVIADEQFSGNGVQVAFTLSSTQTTNSCIVSINGVVQIPTLAYSVSGTNPTCVLTFTEAPASGDVIDVRQITTTTSVTSISNSPGNAVIAVNATVGNVEITGNFMPTSNTIANIGSQSFQFNTIFAQATSAQYADLAEKYAADADYAPGTVVMFGGSAEVTLCVNDACRRVAGVISTNPSYRMNDGLQSAHTAMVALTGRVPTSVTGTVRKGDMMVSAGNGVARAEATPAVGTVIGKALADSEGDAVIEVVVGRV
jgi:fibronectin-binding autotransporter adhesin